MPGPLPADAPATVRAAYRQALARRLAALPAPLRTRLGARLPPPDAPVPAATAVATVPASTPAPSPLAALVHELQSRARPLEQQDARRDWTRLSVEREIARSRAVRPQNPGPLNSQALMLRTLQQLQALAPAYLEAFVAQAEALAWLEDAQPRQARGVNRAARA